MNIPLGYLRAQNVIILNTVLAQVSVRCIPQLLGRFVQDRQHAKARLESTSVAWI
jgi:hypothetical protein